MSVKIIRHAFLMVFRNFGAAIRISFPLFFFAGIGILAVPLLFAPETGIGPGGVLIGGVLFLAEILAVAGVAVGWHRFILLDERKTGLFSSFSQKQILPYLLKVVLVLLVVMVVAVLVYAVLVVLLFLTGFVVPGETPMTLFIIIYILLTMVVLWISSRISIVLPAVSIESDLSFGEAIAATKPYKLAALFVAIFGGIFSANAMFLDYLMPSDALMGSLLITVIVNWFAMMLGLSILTTLYGVAVEGRSVD
jgi:hypothetical protein